MLNYNDNVHLHVVDDCLRLEAAKPLASGIWLDECVVREPHDQYWFVWEHAHFVFGSGNAQLYNHSDQPNIVVQRDYVNRAMYFVAARPIGAGEELCHRYPDWARYGTAGVHTTAACGTPGEQEVHVPPRGARMQRHGLRVGPSEIDRLGVFTDQDIDAGELVEIAVVQPANRGGWYAWSEGRTVFGAGLAHLIGVGERNVGVVRDTVRGTLGFVCLRHIARGDTLLIGSRDLHDAA